MLTVIRSMVFGAFLAIFALSGFASKAEAAGCKGVAKSSCERRSDCTWVSGYITKDKVKVSSYCRAAAKKKTTKKKNVKPKTTKKKLTKAE